MDSLCSGVGGALVDIQGVHLCFDFWYCLGCLPHADLRTHASDQGTRLPVPRTPRRRTERASQDADYRHSRGPPSVDRGSGASLCDVPTVLGRMVPQCCSESGLSPARVWAPSLC